jgi:hypothetical protein
MEMESEGSGQLPRRTRRVQLAYTTRSPTFTVDSIFARFPGMMNISLGDQQYMTATQLEQQNTAISPFKT